MLKPNTEYGGQSENIELNSEVIVLSSIMANPKLLFKIYSRMSEKLFYITKHKVIWRSINYLYENNGVIDLASIVSTIEKEKLYRSSLHHIVIEIASIVIIGNIDTIQYHIGVLVEMYMIREKEFFAKRMLDETKVKTKYSNLVEIANDHNIMFIDDRDAREFKPQNLKEIICVLNKESEEAIENGKPRNKGISTGFITIDDMFILRPQNVYCIAARPAMGKTSLALKIALNAAMNGYRILFFSLEMSQEELLEKIMSILHKKSNEEIRSMKESELIALRKKTAEYLTTQLSNLIIDDFATSIQEIKSAAYDEHRKKKLDAVFLDYLQLIESPSRDGNRNQEITKISRDLKTQIAKKLKIPVIALSQLNRSLESRKDKRPKLSDLRESGSIEQDMTVVMFIYRDEIYGNTIDKRMRSTKNMAELLIEKNRFGKSPNKKRIGFTAPHTDFFDLSPKDSIL